MSRLCLLVVALSACLVTIGQTTILSEDFNGTATGWTKVNSSTGGTPANAAWTLEPDGYHYVSVFIDETFHSNDNTQFILTNSDAQGDDIPPPNTETILQSPSFSTAGYASVTLQFYHNFWPASSSDQGVVEVSTNGTTWTAVATYTNQEGTANSFVQKSVNLSAYAGNGSVYVRFHYYAQFGNYWAIDNVTVTGTLIVTPVSLLSFSGYRDNNTNLLKWTTASEQNNKGFEINRSVDGVKYLPIGFVSSHAQNGNSAIVMNYTFIDKNLAGSKQYYRLRQIDFDNREKLSNIILIKGERANDLSVLGTFPNPANSSINIIVNAPNAEKIQVIITDAKGNLAKRLSVSVGAGTNTVVADISRLSSGGYWIKIIGDSNLETAIGKFIKQ